MGNSADGQACGDDATFTITAAPAPAADQAITLGYGAFGRSDSPWVLRRLNVLVFCSVVVVGIWQVETLNEVFESSGDAVGDRFAHKFPCADKLGFVEVWPSREDRGDHLIEDVLTPMGSEEPSHGEPYQEVTQSSVMEHAGVVGGVERHWEWVGSVVEAEALSFRGEFVGDGLSLGVVALLVGEEVGEQNSASVSYTAVGDLALFEQLHQVGARNVEQVRGLLSGQLCVNWGDSYGVSVGDLGQNVHQQPKCMTGNLQGGTVVVRVQGDQRSAILRVSA